MTDKGRDAGSLADTQIRKNAKNIKNACKPY